MYDELAKRMRKCATEAGAFKACELDSNPSCTDVLMEQAADAIEQLSKDLEQSKEWEAFWEKQAEEAKGKLQQYALAVANKPRWIPVTERLPEDCETVLVDWWNIHCPERHNFSVMRFYKGKTADEVDPYKGIRFCDQWGNNKVPYAWSDPHGPLTLFGQDVTHWMSLPKTPKEE